MALDIYLANTGNDIHHGSVVVGVPGLVAYESDQDQAISRPAYSVIDDQYDDKFDDYDSPLLHINNIWEGQQTFNDGIIYGAIYWANFRAPGFMTRGGVIAPSDEVGFRDNSLFMARNFKHNQADEVQFEVQFPNTWKAGTTAYPNVRFSPWSADTGSVRFVLEYYWANINDIFPETPNSVAMEYTWTEASQWAHFAARSISGIIPTDGQDIGSVMSCRLYRDNTVESNMPERVSLLSFNLRYQVAGPGSGEAGD